MIIRRILATLLPLTTVAAIAVGLPTAASAASVATPAFHDVAPSSSFFGDVAWLVEQKITGGYSDGGFHPAAPVSRQAMAAFLYRADNPSRTAPACHAAAFRDVPKDNAFCGAIAWLVAQKITGGYSDGGFHPTAPVSRQAMAAFLYRIGHTADAPACTASPFTDVATASPFCAAIAWLAGQDITGGYSDGGFHPSAAVSRQAMAAFLHRWADPAPAASTSRYVRTDETQAMATAGAADAAADASAKISPRLHLLQIGAQTTNDLATPGVLLTATTIRLTYAQVVALVSAYVQAYAAAAPGVAVTIAVGTNSDGDYSTYTATEKGTDWWADVVAPLRAAAPANVDVTGADDIEPGFTASLTEAQQWKAAYLAAPDATLIMNGSADGCPTGFGDTSGTCGQGWTLAGIAALVSGSRVSVLPQIYLQEQAVQWANVVLAADAAGLAAPDFVGSLTEVGTCAVAECTFPPSRGWLALWDALTAAGVTPHLTYTTDLAITS